jgi:hypothetical protein
MFLALDAIVAWVACTYLHLKFAWHHLIDITPDPFLAWLNRSHKWMADVLKVLCGMSIFR